MQLFMIELSVSDWGRSLAWYTAVLGFKATLVDQARQFALLEGSGGRIALKGAILPGGREAVRLNFLVDDLDLERDRLARIGIELSETEENTEEHYRIARTSDPDGTTIALFSWTTETRAAFSQPLA